MNLQRFARGGLDWEGIGANQATFAADEGLQAAYASGGFDAVEDKAVAGAGDGEVGFGQAGDPVFGRLHKYERDHNCSVQYIGYTRLPGVPDNLPSPWDPLEVDGQGRVRASASPGSAHKARAISIDDTDNTVMVLLG